MNRPTIGYGTVRTAVEIGCRAPSVHNTQPWSWRWDGRVLQLHADRARQLPGTDPDAGELLLSCGAALHHVRVAFGALDITTVVHRLPDATDPDHLATVELHHDRPVIAPDAITAIERRRTDRRPFTDWPVPEEFLHQLAAAAAEQGATMVPIHEGHARLALLDAIALADDIAGGDPAQSVESQLWSGVFATAEGVPRSAVPADPDGVIGGSRFGSGTLTSPHRSDGAQLVVLGTSSDDRLSRLRAGEACSAVLLHATARGLASAALSRVLEYPATRAAVAEQVLDAALCPQLVVRIGWPQTDAGMLRATPRRPVGEVLTTALP
ncbi:Acg family FMN-binding oxidoreductase [Pseudonocardia sp. GCM10023141]|uniref:Acg family FMN-binding oxidoreductase n=1 Tax=Pseudonocardia sp. GCM10023141 TaxID=3252653 RepID=UPI00361343F2